MDNRVSALFDAYYFAHGCAAPYERTDDFMHFFDTIAGQIEARILGKDDPAKTVLDAGCAKGYLVERLRQRGIQAFGVDVSEFAIENVLPEIRPYCWAGSITDPFPARYDLIVSIEVLEHMPKAEAEKAVANLCRHSDDILFSSTPFDYKEVTHFNVQPPEYWAEQFALHGFLREVDFDASFITEWAVRYRRVDLLPARLVRDYERKFWLLWKENNDLRKLALEMRQQMAAAEQERTALREQGIAREREVEEIQKSRAWKVVKSFWGLRTFFAPAGSRRERLFKKLIGKS